MLKYATIGWTQYDHVVADNRATVPGGCLIYQGLGLFRDMLSNPLDFRAISGAYCIEVMGEGNLGVQRSRPGFASSTSHGSYQKRHSPSGRACPWNFCLFSHSHEGTTRFVVNALGDLL